MVGVGDHTIDPRIPHRNSEEGLLLGCHHAGAQLDPSLLRCPSTLNRSTTASYREARVATKSTVAQAKLGGLIPTSRVPVVVEPPREEM